MQLLSVKLKFNWRAIPLAFQCFTVAWIVQRFEAIFSNLLCDCCRLSLLSWVEGINQNDCLNFSKMHLLNFSPWESNIKRQYNVVNSNFFAEAVCISFLPTLNSRSSFTFANNSTCTSPKHLQFNLYWVGAKGSFDVLHVKIGIWEVNSKISDLRYVWSLWYNYPVFFLECLKASIRRGEFSTMPSYRLLPSHTTHTCHIHRNHDWEHIVAGSGECFENRCHTTANHIFPHFQVLPSQ